ncbi:Peroxiredoxin [Flavobacterium limnosediminis JC2902]|uniref:Peroxiredoxin n=1 Tax=Flavobacterium limnosediminis JC2902 TaxID=1341181 RepID=V6SIA1_9FLAO|nr:TlpA disulfide reductase family protein [Flavobacterium limnosediminis]ESU26433.1 Peroxiredoxin [Flavobacterium limnosediminis JC2902]
MKRLILIKFLLFFCIIYGQDQSDYKQSSNIKDGQSVPDFSFTDGTGKKISMSDLKGKVVLINFFATWCGPCVQEMPYLQKDIWELLKENKNFALLSFGRGHNAEEISKFSNAKKITLPMYPDKEKIIYTSFATKYIPRNYLIDQNGIVVYSSVGFSTEEFEVLKDKINELLK